MCGIAGLYTKHSALRGRLGGQLAAMLEQLSFRGPDSSGVAFYRDAAPLGSCKVSLYSPTSDPDWDGLAEELRGTFAAASSPEIRATHAVFVITAEADEVQQWLRTHHP